MFFKGEKILTIKKKTEIWHDISTSEPEVPFCPNFQNFIMSSLSLFLRGKKVKSELSYDCIFFPSSLAFLYGKTVLNFTLKFLNKIIEFLKLICNHMKID